MVPASRYKLAAKLGWILFVAAFAQSIAFRLLGLFAIPDRLGYGLTIVGLLLAVFALTGIRRHGRSGILAPGLTGLLLNGLAVAAWTVAFTR